MNNNFKKPLLFPAEFIDIKIHILYYDKSIIETGEIMERTLILIKPDTVQRSLAGRIISRFEDKGYKITAMKFMWMTREIAEEHYAPHKGKGFYEPLVKYMTSGPIIAMVVEGYKVIEGARIMMGLTDPLKADQGTIRRILH